MKIKLIILFILLLLTCKSPIIPPTPELTTEITLIWEHEYPETVDGYYFYYGFASRTYESKTDVGNFLEYTIEVDNDKIYYFAVTAYNEIGESDFSNEVER